MCVRVYVCIDTYYTRTSPDVVMQHEYLFPQPENRNFLGGSSIAVSDLQILKCCVFVYMWINLLFSEYNVIVLGSIHALKHKVSNHWTPNVQRIATFRRHCSPFSLCYITVIVIISYCSDIFQLSVFCFNFFSCPLFLRLAYSLIAQAFLPVWRTVMT